MTKCCRAVPSSSPVAVPTRRRTSNSEEHPRSASMAQAASNERSLLSQQIRVNSGSSLHCLNTHHAEAQLNTDPKTSHLDDGLPFPTSNSPEATCPGHSSPPLLNGGPPGGLQEGLHGFMNGSGTQHSSAQSQHHMQRVPESNWEPPVGSQQRAPLLVCYTVSLLLTTSNCTLRTAQLLHVIEGITGKHR